MGDGSTNWFGPNTPSGSKLPLAIHSHWAGNVSSFACYEYTHMNTCIYTYIHTRHSTYLEVWGQMVAVSILRPPYIGPRD